MKKNIFTLAGIVSFLIVNYSLSLSITNQTNLYAMISVEHGDNQCFDFKDVEVKPQATVNITSSCPVKRITAQMINLEIFPIPKVTKVTDAVPYVEPNAKGASLNFRITKDKKYAAGRGFGIEKI